MEGRVATEQLSTPVRVAIGSVSGALVGVIGGAIGGAALSLVSGWLGAPADWRALAKAGAVLSGTLGVVSGGVKGAMDR